MDPTDPQATAPEKKPYRRPELVKVPLRIEEAVLGACKTPSGGGPGSGSDCSVCSAPGS